MKKIITISFIIFCGINAHSQTVNLNGISFGVGAVVESNDNFIDGGYFELGYSKINMTKSGLFYSKGNEFLAKVRYQSSKFENSIGIITGYKYHFLGSLLSLGIEAEYLKLTGANGGELNATPNFQLNMFTPELSVVCSYKINLTSSIENVETSRILLGLRYILAFKKGNRFLDYKNKK